MEVQKPADADPRPHAVGDRVDPAEPQPKPDAYVCVCVYACAYAYVCVCVYVCAYAYVCLCVCLSVRMRVYARMCVCVCMLVCVRVHTYTPAYSYNADAYFSDADAKAEPEHDDNKQQKQHAGGGEEEDVWGRVQRLHHSEGEADIIAKRAAIREVHTLNKPPLIRV